MQHDERRTGTAEFADDQWKRDGHGRNATVEAAGPRSNHFPAQVLNTATGAL